MVLTTDLEHGLAGLAPAGGAQGGEQVGGGRTGLGQAGMIAEQLGPGSVGHVDATVSGGEGGGFVQGQQQGVGARLDLGGRIAGHQQGEDSGHGHADQTDQQQHAAGGRHTAVQGRHGGEGHGRQERADCRGHP